uniref:Uncharacterized protein n=1 Tax=Polytomella parva TaxID=51329 RepID=A0A7S0VF83_9CHLO|eukprot:CAMPEP_0175050654 /NCGR_PEP_ID=MMETSP0052_2-20121109/7375_1 /TAXON_ID=51329 ORGANISM="Polytomella parva, Strain SAG 63-3" /NCGR_SAMPLE_ID=MMETSP0052_2 /ASSEMBLY_ACC=CAM_ASM_000194 /LENGTH=597 /DNA_ID=CAMNT_0016314873 /DNA_START=91 /DNA_END=1884 /DNA_ORIENTATION=+
MSSILDSSSVKKLRASTSSLPRDATKGDDMGSEEVVHALVISDLERFENSLTLSKTDVEFYLQEIHSLKSSIASKDKQILTLEKELEETKDKKFQAEGGLSSINKELSTVKLDKRKLESQVLDLTLHTNSLSDKLVYASSQNPLSAIQVSGLMADIRMSNMERDNLKENNKALESSIRNYEKEISRLLKKLEEAEFLAKRCLELENKCLDFAKQLEDAKSEIRSLQQVVRGRDSEIMKSVKEHDATKVTLTGLREQLSRVTGEYKATQQANQELEREVSLARDELIRASAVAKRVAVFEVRAGVKEECTVPGTRHLEEVKYLSGENQRLKDKMSLLERDLNVSHALTDRFKRAASVNSVRASFSGSTARKLKEDGTPETGSEEESASGSSASGTTATRRPSTATEASRLSSVNRSRPSSAVTPTGTLLTTPRSVSASRRSGSNVRSVVSTNAAGGGGGGSGTGIGTGTGISIGAGNSNSASNGNNSNNNNSSNSSNAPIASANASTPPPVQRSISTSRPFSLTTPSTPLAAANSSNSATTPTGNGVSGSATKGLSRIPSTVRSSPTPNRIIRPATTAIVTPTRITHAPKAAPESVEA